MSEFSLDFDILVNLLRNEQESISKRIWAVNQLTWRYQIKSIFPLCDFLLTQNRVLRRAIIEQIMELFPKLDQTTMEYFTTQHEKIKKLVYDVDIEIRKKALFLTIQTNQNVEENKELIMKGIEDSDPEIRALSLKYAPKFLDQKYIIYMLYDPNEQVIVEAIRLIHELNIKITSDDKKRLKNHRSLKIRMIYIQGLMASAVQTKQYDKIELLEYVMDPLPYFQSIAIKTLTVLNEDILIPYLEQKISHTDDVVVVESLRAVAHFNVIALKPLVILLLKDLRRTVRHTALEVIGKIGSFDDFPYLFPLINDHFYEIRQTLYDILLKIQDPRVINLLFERLFIASLAEKSNIIFLLEQFQVDQIIIPLLQIYRNSTINEIYINEKVARIFPDPKELRLIRYLKNLSIVYLVECLSDQELQPLALKIIPGWGITAVEVLQQKLEELEKHIDVKNDDLISLIKNLINQIRARYKIKTNEGFSLLL